MASLPDAVTMVGIPEYFRPSQLPYVDHCALRVVAPGLHVARLPSGPQAARGSLAHAFLDVAARGVLADRSPEGLKNELVRQLDALEQELSRDPATVAFACLERTLPPLAWRNFLRRLVASAIRVLERPSVPHERQYSEEVFSGGRRFETLPSEGFWTEVPIASAQLRLSGRMDAVEKHGDRHVVIRDYKTGLTVDDRGQVREEVARQLRLYGLIVIQLLAGARVELLADDGTEHLISFHEEDVVQTRAWLSDVLAKLPASASMPAMSLANPGATCAGCGIRHVCPAYRQFAPNLWRDGTDFAAMPMDVWGVVRALSADAEGTVTVDLEDAAGRKVKIFRLDLRHDALRSARAGDELWFFGLAGWAPRGADSLWKHPRNFWEIPADATQRRAWSLAVFSGHSCEQNL